jgi:hypothetical protein
MLARTVSAQVRSGAGLETVTRTQWWTQGVPWWTVIAADADGDTLFSQLQVIANVPDAHADRW